jgi:hypothetical protein
MLAKVGSFNTGTGAAASTVAVTGVGFTPKVVKFWWTGRTNTTDTVGRANIRRGYGWAISTTDRRVICDFSEDAVATSDASRAHSEGACIMTVNDANAIDGALDLQSMDSDGFTLVVDDQMPVDLRIHYLALAGDDLTNIASLTFTEPGATGNQDTTGAGFQPDYVEFISNGETTAPPDGSGNARLMIGAYDGTNQAVLMAYVSNGEATMDTRTYCTTGECIALCSAAIPPTVTGRADGVSFLSDGFRLNWVERAEARYIFALCMKGGDYTVGTLQTQTDTTTDITESGLGYEPAAVQFFSHCNTESTSDTLQDNDRISIGAFSGYERGAQGSLDEDGVADSEVTTAIEFDAVYVNISTASAVQGLMDIKTIGTDGFTCIMDDADPSQAFVWYAAFGPAPEVTFPQTAVLDDFNRADGASLGANWLHTYAAGQAANFDGGISSNQAYNPDSGTAHPLYYTVAQYGPDCEAYVTMPVLPAAGSGMIVGARISGVGGAGYSGYAAGIVIGAAGNDAFEINRIDTGVSTLLRATYIADAANSSAIGLEIRGSTITMFYKVSGGSWLQIMSVTDSTYASAGYLLLILPNDGSARYDDFGGGTVRGNPWYYYAQQ